MQQQNIAAFLRPSAAHTWVVCHGYAQMRSHYPEAPDEADNDVREDGTACHWLASEVWNGRHPKIGSLSPNQRVIDEDMYDAVDMYLDVLRSWIEVDRHDVHCENTIPTSILFPDIPGAPDGTPDAWKIDVPKRTIRVGDLKYGFRFVEAWENWQLVVYGATLCMMQIPPGQDEYWHVELTIVQPRSYHRDGPVRTWRVRASDLRAYVNILQSAAAQSIKPNAPCTPNPGCVDCPARHACMALQNSAASAIEQSYAGIPLELTPAAIGDELRRLKDAFKRMEARITGLEMQAENVLRGGKVVPGWALRPSYARETWREGTEQQVIALGMYYGGVNLARPARPITPNQARKAGLPADVVDVFAHKPSTGVKLVKQDPYEAAKAFSKNPIGE